MNHVTPPALFSAQDLRACLLKAEDGPRLQEMFERCDDYFGSVTGLPVGPAEAQSMFMVLPEGKGYEDKFLIGIFDHHELVGMIEAIRNYPKQAIWWIGLMLLVPERRGKRLGTAVYQALEKWIAGQGGREVRLAVAEPLTTAVAFWRKLGFAQVEARKLRAGVRESTYLVMSQTVSVRG